MKRLQFDRERVRQRNIRVAFARLRQIVPAYPNNGKLSKLAILRAAIRYLTILEYILGHRSKPLTYLFP